MSSPRLPHPTMTRFSLTKPWLFALFVFLYLPFVARSGLQLLREKSVDYPSYYYAATTVFNEGKTPYGAATRFGGSTALPPDVKSFLYPPPALVAFWPLSKVSFAAGKAALLVASHLGYLWAIWLLLARLRPAPADERLRDLLLALALVYLLRFDPAVVTLMCGQINLVVLPFLCLAFAGMRNNSASWRIALPLAVAILLKTYPILFFVPLIFHKRFKPVALTCLYLGGVTAVAALVLPTDVWSSWIHDVLPIGGYGEQGAQAGGPWNQNINAFVCRLFLETEWTRPLLPYGSLVKPIATFLGLAVFAVSALLAYRAARRAGSGAVGDDELALFLLMIFLVAPLSWEHHLVYLLPAIPPLIGLLLSKQIPRLQAFVVVAAMLMIAWSYPADSGGLQHGWLVLGISAKFYAVLALWLFFVLRLRAGAALNSADLPTMR